jgi:ATP-binding cassette subfamily F protein uup
VLTARLMLQPADLLLLDEPTNDLDIPTLEVLEESLTEFPGALVLVTHDRYLMDRVSTAVMGLDGQCGATIYSDYWQWEAAQARDLPKPERPTPPASDPSRDRKGAIFKKKLSYLEAREWERMETQILEAEGALDAIHAEMQSPDVVSDGVRLQDCYAKLQPAEACVAALYARWAELEAKQ